MGIRGAAGGEERTMGENISKTNEVRPIDANALLENGIFSMKYGYIGNGLQLIQMAINCIRNAPTIDAEPVRHGRWIQSKIVPAYHYCSLCKETHKMKMSCNVYVLLKYCPNCGVKMGGEEDAKCQN